VANEAGDIHSTSELPPADEAAEAPKKKKREESSYIPSDGVRALQNLLETQEKKRVLVSMLIGKANQGSVMIENESKTIRKEAQRKRVSLELEVERMNKEFAERFEKITADENAEIAALEANVNLIRAEMHKQQRSLDQVNTQIGVELSKMGVIKLAPEGA
jgi:hypothetical protein